jgi:hypothetical protein
MRKAIGTALWSLGHVGYALTLLCALVYLFGSVVWMHAPVLAALQVTVMMALVPLGLAWLCRRIGRRLRASTPAAPSSPAKRWILAGIGIVTAAACARLVHTGLNEYRCSEDRAQHAVAYAAQAQRNGYERVCGGGLARFDVAFLPNAIATRNLAFTPVDLTRTPFARLDSLGSRAETAVGVRSRLYRGFRMPDGHRLTLYEEDMSANGLTSWRNPKDEPERINGLAARLVVMEDPSGKAVSLLSWMEGRRDYQLWIDANVVRVPLRGQLFALAASLPHAVPACPNEPPPLRYDAEGRPVNRAQADAMTGNGERPCK